MFVQRSGSIYRSRTILSGRGGRSSKVRTWETILINGREADMISQVPCVPCQDYRMGWGRWGCDWTHIQDSDSVVNLECEVIRRRMSLFPSTRRAP